MKLDDTALFIKDNLQNILDGKFDDKFSSEQLKMMLEMSFLYNHITFELDSVLFDYNGQKVKVSGITEIIHSQPFGISAEDQIFSTIKSQSIFKSSYASFLRDCKLNALGIKEYEPHCHICYSTNVEPEMVCDICDELYCEDCSYTFSLHYQHQGARCYSCADQSRRTPLDKRDIKLNKVFLKNKSI